MEVKPIKEKEIEKVKRKIGKRKKATKNKKWGKGKIEKICFACIMQADKARFFLRLAYR